MQMNILPLRSVITLREGSDLRSSTAKQDSGLGPKTLPYFGPERRGMRINISLRNSIDAPASGLDLVKEYFLQTVT